MSERRPKGWGYLKFWKYYEDSLRPRLEQLSQEIIVPKKELWFKALELVKPKDVKCIIIGQDPYPTPGHAHGLAFSVMPHVRPFPRSLNNIFLEYRHDLGFPRPATGDLSPWAQQGVLLLNRVLTNEAGLKFAHEGLGWERLAYEITRLMDESTNPVFVLWGKYAQELKGAIRSSPVVCSSHPSPMSAKESNEPFLGSKPFSRVNEYLTSQGRMPIQWKLP